jgi:hypothetical protein
MSQERNKRREPAKVKYVSVVHSQTGKKTLVRMWKDEFSRIVPSRLDTAKFAGCKEHAHQKQPQEGDVSMM